MSDYFADLSEVRGEECIGSCGIVLKPSLVQTQSLMQVHSRAHDDRLKACLSTGKLAVTVMDELLSSQSSSGWVNVCRICHGGESTEQLVAPCRCKGSVALTHLSCLERWLKESHTNNCELCHQEFEVLRRPRYSLPRSILVWMFDHNARGPRFTLDAISFCIYTPSALCATYALMLLCDATAKLHSQFRARSAHIVAFLAVAGMAAIDFTYTSWLMSVLQRHVTAWRTWFDETCQITVVLPPRKRPRPRTNSSGTAVPA